MARENGQPWCRAMKIDDEAWAKWWSIGARRSGGKREYGSSAYLEVNSHEMGTLGEYYFGRLVGVEPADDVGPLGDAGFDFVGVDVKATGYVWDPWLKVREEKASVGMCYPLITINLRTHYACYIGYADYDLLQQHPLERLKLDPAKASRYTGRRRPEDEGPLSHVIRSGLYRGLPPGYSYAL